MLPVRVEPVAIILRRFVLVVLQSRDDEICRFLRADLPEGRAPSCIGTCTGDVISPTFKPGRSASQARAMSPEESASS